MQLQEFLHALKTTPETIEFEQAMDVISRYYRYTPTQFSNGLGDDRVINEAGSNEGSCKIFAFARLNDLSKDETLACFGRLYRDDILPHPDATDHTNIRSFMRHGWSGIRFSAEALIPN